MRRIENIQEGSSCKPGRGLGMRTLKVHERGRKKRKKKGGASYGRSRGGRIRETNEKAENLLGERGKEFHACREIEKKPTEKRND